MTDPKPAKRPGQSKVASKAQPAIEELLNLRENLHLLLGENPNHFGNLVESEFKPTFEIISDVEFEQLTCLGLNPDTDTLEATVQVKRASGYGGDLCSPGSTEWVRFYISYDDGANWSDVGLGSFNAHDIPDSVDCGKQKTKPLVYTVSYPLSEPLRRRCAEPVLPLARAILSWQVMPPAGQPNWQPIWGNRIEHHVQIKPRRLILRDVIDQLDLNLDALPKYLQAVLPHPLPELEASPFSLADAVKAARVDKIPAHRFATPLLANAVAEGTLSQSNLLATIGELKNHGIDWAKLIKAYLSEQGDTTYEQLNCLGLDYNRDLLVATIQVKLPSGFSGAPCTPGSVEYVAFWVDYDDNCKWTYLDTAKVVVHDFKPLPADGLHYWVGVPAKTAEHARTCKEPKVGRIRAVLSWNTPPSTTNPNLMPRWGNAVETHIEIPPRRRVTNNPEIRALGRIPVQSIDASGLTIAGAGVKFIEFGSPVDSLDRACPFGGTVTVHAYANDTFASSGYSYRAMWRPAGGSGTGTPVKDPFVTGFFPVVTRTPDPMTGYTPYLSTALNPMGQLAAWRTRGVVVDGDYELRLEMVDSAYNLLGTTAWYPIRVDNTAPTTDLTLSSGTPCNKANPGDLVQGTFVATDPYFGSYSLDTLPASLNPPAPTHNPTLTTSSVAAGTWSLQTDGNWPQCGYVVQLWTYDRS
ncbi:MAG: hypothetical protein ABI418_08525, partial [Jatrophihabitantaceae bacterium]